MKAIIYENYGSPNVLKLKDIEKPQPKDNEILIRVRASTVTSGVAFVRGGKHPNSKLFTFLLRIMFGFKKPKVKVLGYEFAGEVEKKGKNVKTFKKGDKVFGTTTGLKQGAYAEYVCVPEIWNSGVISIMPKDVSFDEAAALPIGGMTALYLLKKANIKKGQNVLVYGASGSVGTYAIQLAKYFGAKVTGVCSTANLDLVKSIGADFVIDYTKEDFRKIKNKFDIIFDAVGKISSSDCNTLLSQNGKFTSVFNATKEKTDYLLFLRELAEKGEIKPVIDKTYSMDEIVEAHSYVDKGHKKGNVVISIK